MVLVNSIKSKILMIIATLCLFASNLAAQENYLPLVGQWPYGTCSAVNVNENLLYMSNGPTLQIYNITDKANPELLSETLLHNDLWAIKVANDLAFVSLGGPGIQIIDVSDPANPTLLGFYDQNSVSVFSIQLLDDDKLVIADQVSIAVVDISDPNNPVRLGIIFTAGLDDCKVKGNYIYTANNSKGLQVFDMTNPDSLYMVTEYDLGDYAFNPHGIVIRDDYAFLSTTDAGLVVVDISNPLNPRLVTSVPTAINGRTIDLEGDIVSIGHHFGQVFLLDISDEENPEILYELDLESHFTSLDVNNGFLHVANIRSGLQIFDITDPANPFSVSQIATPGPSIWIHVYEDRDEAFVIAGDIYVLDISDKNHPKIKVKIGTGEIARDLVVVDDFMYVANRTDGFIVYNISDLENVDQIGHFNVSQYGSGVYVGTATNVVIDGDLAFVTIGYEGLLVLDISDKSAPKLAKRLTGFQMWKMTQDGDLLFITDGVDDVNIIDISNPLEPVKLDLNGKLYGYSDAAVRDDKVYTVGFGFYIYDVSDKTKPDSLWGDDDVRGVNGIALAGNHAYIAGDNDGLLMFDISDPAGAMHLVTTKTYDEAIHVAATDDYIYVADYNGGILIYENKLTPTSIASSENLPANFTLEQNYPNPFNPATVISYTLEKSGPVELTVYNQLGRTVQTLVKDYRQAGNYSVQFDGRGLSSGIYFVKLLSNSNTQVRKMTLVK